MRCIEIEKYHDNKDFVDRIFFTLEKLIKGVDFNTPNVVELIERFPWAVKNLNILKRFIRLAHEI
jgi:hypothetical protein